MNIKQAFQPQIDTSPPCDENYFGTTTCKVHEGQKFLYFFGYPKEGSFPVNVITVWEDEIDEQFCQRWELLDPVFGITGSVLPRLRRK